MNWSWKKFFYYFFRNTLSNLKSSILVGMGIFIFVGFITALFTLAYGPLERIGQEIIGCLLKSFGHSIDLPSGAGFATMTIISVLLGKFLTTKKIQRETDWLLSKIPLIGWVWKQIRNLQRGLEQLKNYRVVRIRTFSGIKEIFLVKRLKWERIKLLDGNYKNEGWRAEGFLPSLSNPTAARAFISVDPETIDAKITNSFEEVLAYIFSCTISAPEPNWTYQEIDWEKDFGIDINSSPQDTD